MVGMMSQMNSVYHLLTLLSELQHQNERLVVLFDKVFATSCIVNSEYGLRELKYCEAPIMP